MADEKKPKKQVTKPKEPAKGVDVPKPTKRAVKKEPAKNETTPKSRKGKAAPNTALAQTDFYSRLTDFDTNLFKAGKHFRIYEKLGSHVVSHNGVEGVYFAVWAPNARSVSVMGSFNGWDKSRHPLNARWDGSGIWEGLIPEAKKGNLYKYYIISEHGFEVAKGDPYAYQWEEPPRTASVVADLAFEWSDQDWMNQRGNALEKPMSIYEVHIGSWRKKGPEVNDYLTYREMAEQLPEYCKYMGYTHVEMMPVMEHPFFGSWGYQITGYFAPSSRFGSPQDFMHLVNALHQNGIGVILDWVPSHFPGDEHGLVYFDGTHLYEHADPRKGFHPDWKSFIFNYGRSEVQCFLVSNALFWLDKFHIDGLRVDAVASMLYLDYSRKAGEWEPNEHGGRENLEAIHLLREFNHAVHQNYPEAFTVAEESTAWPGVTQPEVVGGLGFDLKWMMGWMHDTLKYLQNDPLYRSYHQGQITFSMIYAYSEKFVLPLSHDEVVYGKGSLINKMPGDEWQKRANLRLLYAYMYGHPGAKLLFMGGEFGQWGEWGHDHSLEWDTNSQPNHQGIQKLVKTLNELYRDEPALYENNYAPEGFAWIDNQDYQNSVLSWMRKSRTPEDYLIFVANFTPTVRHNYAIGVPEDTVYTEVLNSDAEAFGGANNLNGSINVQKQPAHGFDYSVALTLPPLGVSILKPKRS